MKIRTDFVSNSSSSSFILADTPDLEVCNVTKQDIIDALIDAYGKEDFEKFIDEHKNTPFYVYDLQDPKDKKEAIKKWAATLKGWSASNCYLALNGELEFGTHKSEDYAKLIKYLEEVFNFSTYDITSDESINNLKKWIHTDERQPDGLYGYYVDVPQYIKDTILAAKSVSGIVDNEFVLKHDNAKFFVHFEENEAWHGKMDVSGKHEEKYEIWSYDVAKGRTDWQPTKEEIDHHNEWVKKQNAEIDSSIYETDCDTGNRIFEVIYNWLVKVGKVKPADQKLLETYGMDHNNEWCTTTGRSYTWRDLANDCLTICCHEGFIDFTLIIILGVISFFSILFIFLI